MYVKRDDEYQSQKWLEELIELIASYRTNAVLLENN